MTALPRAVEPLVGFAPFLREHGFVVVQDQIIMFLAAVRLLGPAGMDSIRRAAHATLAPPPDRRREFDALFRAYFHEEANALAIARSMAEEDAPAKDGGSGMDEASDATKSNRSGEAATATEILSIRSFGEASEHEVLRRLRCEAPQKLPRRLSFRRAAARAGAIDLRRSLRSVVRNDGDVIRLVRAGRARIDRPVLVLIDVSGSMKRHTEDYLRFAHALTQAAKRVETFTFGTRLTRITQAMSRR